MKNRKIFENVKGIDEIDYVCAWYRKSADIMTDNPKIRTALVSKNSIKQGMQTGEI